MWHAKRRLRRLESSLAEARADQADLVRRLEMFEEIAAAAGLALRESPGAEPAPAALVAAARDARRGGALVRLDVDARKVVAVIDGQGGDPREWWLAIRHFASRLRSASSLYLERVALPPGLSAIGCRDPHGDLAVYVSDALDSASQRAAVMEAIRASRRPGWQAGLGPVGAAVALLIALRSLLLRAARPLRARPVAWVAAATAAAAGASAAGILLAVPHHHGPPASGRGPAPAIALPGQPQGQQRGHRRHQALQPVPAAGISPGTGRAHLAGQPGPGQVSPAPGSPAPGPSPSPAPPASPSPSPAPPAPSPAPPGGGTGVCVVVLGHRVCLPLVSLAVRV